MDVTSGLILAFAYVATPGPITVETLRQGMKGGFHDSLAVQSGSLIGVIVYALLAFFGAGLLLQDPRWHLALGVSGMVLLLYLGITTIRTAHQMTVHASERLTRRTPPRGAFWTGASLSLANPLDIVFWLSMGSRVISGTDTGGQVFLVGFALGCLLTSVGIALCASFGQHLLTPKSARATSWISGLTLIGFGLKLGFSIVGQLFVI